MRGERGAEIICGGREGNSRKEKQEGEEKKEEGKKRGTRGNFECGDNVYALCQREGKRARGVGADLSCGSICEHVTHMERPLYA